MKWLKALLFHEYVAVGVEQLNVVGWNHLKGEIISGTYTKKTVILYRCVCGKVKSGELDGHWTLDQVLGKKETT